jgi:hypothetical protein
VFYFPLGEEGGNNAFNLCITSYLAYVCIRLKICIRESCSETVGLCNSSTAVVLKAVTVQSAILICLETSEYIYPKRVVEITLKILH